MKTSDGKNPRLPPYKYHPAQKEARLSARVLAEVQVGRGEEELRCNSCGYITGGGVGNCGVWVRGAGGAGGGCREAQRGSPPPATEIRGLKFF